MVATLNKKANLQITFWVPSSGHAISNIQGTWNCCCCQVASVVSDSVRPHGLQPTRLLRPWDSPGQHTGVGCHVLLQRRKMESESEVAQSCPTLSDPMDCKLPGSSIHGIFRATVLEWGAIAFSQPEISSLEIITRFSDAPSSPIKKLILREEEEIFFCYNSLKNSN